MLRHEPDLGNRPTAIAYVDKGSLADRSLPLRSDQRGDGPSMVSDDRTGAEPGPGVCSKKQSLFTRIAKSSINHAEFSGNTAICSK